MKIKDSNVENEPKSDLRGDYVRGFYELSEGNASKASRMIKYETGKPITYSNVIEHWRAAGLAIKGQRGPMGSRFEDIPSELSKVSISPFISYDADNSYRGQESDENHFSELPVISDDMSHALEAIKKLPEMHQKVLSHRYGLNGYEPKTLEKTAGIVGRTRERIRQIEIRGLSMLLEKIEDGIDEEKLRGYNFDRKYETHNIVPTIPDKIKTRRRNESIKSLAKSDRVSKLISELPKNYQEILFHYNGINGYKKKSRKQVGDIIGASQITVEQINRQVCSKLFGL